MVVPSIPQQFWDQKNKTKPGCTPSQGLYICHWNSSTNQTMHGPFCSPGIYFDLISFYKTPWFGKPRQLLKTIFLGEV